MSLELSSVLFALSLFLAVVLFLEGLWNLWSSRHGPGARRLAERLSALSQASVAPVAMPSDPGAQVASPERPWWSRGALGDRFAGWIRASAARQRFAQGLPYCVAGAAAAGAVLMAAGAPAGVVGAGVAVGALAPGGVRRWRREAHSRRMEQQFPQALDLLSRALRAGHALPAAVRMAAEELPHPLVKEFRLLFEEMNYGVAVPEALTRFSVRVPLADASYFAVAVTLQRESGGNLAEVLDKIASLVRERLRLRGEVRTLSAEGRLSAVILTGLPFAVAAVVQSVNPRFLSVLWTDPAGPKLVGWALAGIVVGVLWMRTIIRIRV